MNFKKNVYYSVPQLNNKFSCSVPTLYAILARPEFNCYLLDKYSMRRKYFYCDSFISDVKNALKKKTPIK